MKTAGFRPALQSSRLLDQVRERIRYCHYSLRTEQIYVYWIRFFIRFSGVRHPRAMGVRAVEAFLTHLASERKVSPATHRQALVERFRPLRVMVFCFRRPRRPPSLS